MRPAHVTVSRPAKFCSNTPHFISDSDPAVSRPTAPLHERRRMMRWLSTVGIALLCSIAASCSSITEPRERLFTLEVAEQRVPCVGMFPRECLQARERSDAPWELFYDPIEGFTYEPGFRYVLRVAERRVPDPPADGSSLAYRLLLVVSKTAAP
jgi:hypothetical protein